MAINTEIPINKVILDYQEIRLEEPNLITKEITENGTYNATDDNADGYSSVTVNVASSGGGGGEEVITEVYTDMVALTSKAIELVKANRFCQLRVVGMKTYDAELRTASIETTGTTFSTTTSSAVSKGTDRIFYPQSVTNTACTWSGVDGWSINSYTGSTAPVFNYIFNACWDGKVYFMQLKDTVNLNTLISGGYIQLVLCYI